MYSAMVLVAFHAFLRIGEYTTKGGQESHVIQREHVQFSIHGGKLTGMALTLFHFKHSKREVTLELKARIDEQFCPVKALARHIGIKGPKKGPIFINEDGCPVSFVYIAYFICQPGIWRCKQVVYQLKCKISGAQMSVTFCKFHHPNLCVKRYCTKYVTDYATVYSCR